MKSLYIQALALEMLLEAIDDRIFTNRLERLKPPKVIDADNITDKLWVISTAEFLSQLYKI